MPEERRRGSRFPLDAKVELTGDGKTPIKADGVNISKYGILCNTESAVDQSSEKAVQVEIALPESGKKVELGGVIVRTEKRDETYQTGISFTEVDADDKDKLDEFLTSFEIPSGDDQFIEMP